MTHPNFIRLISALIVAVCSACGTKNNHEPLTSLRGQEVQPEPIKSEEKETLKKALKLLFSEPSKGEKPTDKFKAYLRYQEDRIALVEQIFSANSDDIKRVLSQKLIRLDQEFINANFETKQTMQFLSGSILHFYNDKTTSFDRIEKNYPTEFETWKKSRTELVEKFKAEQDGQKKRIIVQKLNSLDNQFQLKFLWFVADLG